jgi:hypothetical protein
MSRFATPFLGTLIPALEQESFIHGDTGLGHKTQRDRDFHAGVIAVHFLLDRPWWYRVWCVV